MLTPGGATIFEATGTTDIAAEFGASIDIGNSGADTQSNFQAASTYAGEARLSPRLMYTLHLLKRQLKKMEQVQVLH